MARLLVAANSTWNLGNFRAGLIEALIRAGHEVTTLSPDRHGIVIDKNALPHSTWQMDRSGTNPGTDIASLLSMIRTVRQTRPDVFLGFTVKPNIYGSIACRLLNVAAMPNVSGLGTTFLSGSTFRRAILIMYRFAFARTKVVFFQNPDDAALFLEERVVQAGQARVLPGSGVNTIEFSPTALPREPKFLMIARLLADKGVREYVAAARQVKQKIPEAKFSLLGQIDHQNRSAIGEAELQQWIAEGVIDYLGATNDVRPFIRQSAAVVLPSYREGLPRTLLEAAAMGRPLIGSDVPGCRQVVRDGVTGYLCEARSIDSLAAAMERFANSTYVERVAMAGEARAMVESEFDQRFVFDAYLREINSLATGEL